MLLMLDIGNSNIKTGLFEDGRLTRSWRVSTDRTKTADEYGIMMASFFDFIKRDMKAVGGIFISSVAPSVNYTIEHMCRLYFGLLPKYVSHKLKCPLTFAYDDPAQLGTDRICNSVAAVALYGAPCITVDFGTATTYTAVSADKKLLGGAIAPGIKISLSALIENTSRLPNVELEKPDNVICKNTIGAIQSGMVFGGAGQVDYIIKRMRRELSVEKIPVIATGGLAQLLASEVDSIDEMNDTLTLEGLNMLYQLNFGG